MFSFCHNSCWLLGKSFANCENLTDYCNYNHNVDMAMVQGATQSQRSIVNNWKISNVLKLNYRPDDNYEFTLHGGGTYYLIKSQRERFSNIHAGDYNIGMNA